MTATQLCHYYTYMLYVIQHTPVFVFNLCLTCVCVFFCKEPALMGTCPLWCPAFG